MATAVLIVCIICSAVLHLVLFISDSDTYRQWVTIQIVLQIIAATSLWYVRQFKLLALALFVILTIPFIYINVIYINYGNIDIHMIFVPLFFITYGSLIFNIRKKFLL